MVDSDHQVDVEFLLAEKAFIYLTENSYPINCTKNEKRSIRRRSEKLRVCNGEFLYKRKDGNEAY